MRLSDIPARIRQAVHRCVVAYNYSARQVKNMLLMSLSASGMLAEGERGGGGASKFCGAHTNHAVSTFLRSIVSPDRKWYTRRHVGGAPAWGSDGGAPYR